MSFGDLESGNKRPKQWCGEVKSEDSCFEQEIRANIRELQECIRRASQQLDRAHTSCISKRMSDSFSKALENGQDLAQELEQLFRDWTVHLAGEPALRHKKKLSYEKLQKAFREEVDRLKDAGRRAVAVRQEVSDAEARYSASSSVECHGMCEDHGSSCSDEEHCLLATSSTSEVATIGQDVAIQNRIAQEREEGIQRIQTQVGEVNQIFRDLASIVNEQGQHFESIEQQAEAASSNTRQVVKELKKTTDRQRSHFERLCCMLATAMLVLCFVLVQHMPHWHTALKPSGLK